MSEIKILLEFKQPPAPVVPDEKKVKQEKLQKECKLSVEDQVKTALDLIKSDHKSEVQWSMINRLYKKLKATKKKSERIDNLIAMIEPVLNHFGYYGQETNKVTGNGEEQ